MESESPQLKIKKFIDVKFRVLQLVGRCEDVNGNYLWFIYNLHCPLYVDMYIPGLIYGLCLDYYSLHTG